MSIQVPQPATVEAASGIDPTLLDEARAFLDARRRGLAPDPRLSRAWESFYLACDPVIRRCAEAYPMTTEDRLDCVQETWALVLSRLGRFRYDPGRGRFESWLRALARNKAVDVIRRRRRHPMARLSDQAEDSLCDRGADPAAEYERRRERAAVRGTLEHLAGRVSPGSYQVLHLRWMEGRSVPEIAAALGLTPQQVHVRHHRALRALRHRIERAIRGGAVEPTRS